MLIISRKDIRELQRAQVSAVGPRKYSSGAGRGELGSKLRLSVWLPDGAGGEQVVDLLRGDDPHITTIVQAWHSGSWPLPLPRESPGAGIGEA